MRTTSLRSSTAWACALAGCLGASALGACKWTAFDDLEDGTWVDSTGKPDVKSSDWGVAIQRGAGSADTANGATLAVIGAGPGTYSELSYNQSGDSTFQSNSLVLGGQGIMTLDSPPFLLASPTSAEVALVTTGDAGSIVVATGIHTLAVRQLFVTTTTLEATVTIATTPDAAAYMQPLPFPGIATPPEPEVLVAVGNVVMGTVVGLPGGSRQPACKLTDGANEIRVRALSAVPGVPGPTDDVLAWNGVDGRLLRYAGSVFNGCVPTDPPVVPQAPTTTQVKPAFVPGRGSQILTIDATRVLLQGHQDVTQGTGSFLQVYNSATLQPIGNAATIEGARSAAILDTGTAKYAVVGYPNAIVDTQSAGQVLVYEITAAGLQTTPVATLHDAQPEDNQSFGRAVAVIPYRGKQVIAVSADNEIFVYFKVLREGGAELYGETRQAR